MIKSGLIRSVLCLWLAVLLAACGALPRPFQPRGDSAINPLIEQGVPADIAVNPVRGATVPMAKLLTKSILREIARYDIVSYANDRGASSFVLNGEVTGSPLASAGQEGNHQSGRVINWQIVTREGVVAKQFRTPITGPAFDWDYGSPRIIREVGENTAREVATLMIGRTASLQQDKTVRSGVWIKPVSDAPGDGNFSLTRAMAFTLSDHGIRVVKSAALAKHFLKGRVRVDPPESGKQKVEVTWVVTDTNGKEIGRARQRNVVPAGTFDGRWGQTAVMISMAAVGGIKNIITSKATQSLNQGKQPFKLVFPSFSKDKKLTIPQPSLEAE